MMQIKQQPIYLITTLLLVILSQHQIKAHGDSPGSCHNPYDYTILGLQVSNGIETFYHNITANDQRNITAWSETGLETTLIIQIASKSRSGNTLTGTAWRRHTYLGFGMSSCGEDVEAGQVVEKANPKLPACSVCAPIKMMGDGPFRHSGHEELEGWGLFVYFRVGVAPTSISTPKPTTMSPTMSPMKTTTLSPTIPTNTVGDCAVPCTSHKQCRGNGIVGADENCGSVECINGVCEFNAWRERCSSVFMECGGDDGLCTKGPINSIGSCTGWNDNECVYKYCLTETD